MFSGSTFSFPDAAAIPFSSMPPALLHPRGVQQYMPRTPHGTRPGGQQVQQYMPRTPHGTRPGGQQVQQYMPRTPHGTRPGDGSTISLRTPSQHKNC